jgi:hypothetical protein
MATITVKKSWIAERKTFQLSSVRDLRRNFDQARKDAMKRLGTDPDLDAKLQARVDASFHMLTEARGF